MNSLIAFCLDQSGSMSDELTVAAFNKFLTMMQYRIDDCELTLATFDDVYTPLVEFQSIFEVPMMSHYPYTTSLHYSSKGSTLLNDSVAIMVKSVEERLAKMPVDERPTNITLVVQTDGGDNLSRNKPEEIAKIVRGVIAKGWNVLYIGEMGYGADTQAIKLGFPTANFIGYTNIGDGFGDVANKILESVVTGSIGRV